MQQTVRRGVRLQAQGGAVAWTPSRPLRSFSVLRCAAPERAVVAERVQPSQHYQEDLARTAQNIVPAGSLRARFSSNGRVPAGAAHVVQLESVEPTLPLWVALSDDVCKACAQQPEAVLAGLKALRVLGVWGVTLDVHWAQVEQSPRQYSWAAYRPILALVWEAGLKLEANFCFHADQRHALPGWVLDIGEELPDIFFTDKSGCRSNECLSLGVDDVPVLAGRSAVQCYADLMASFASEHSQILGSFITDARIGLGPAGELRYPSHPAGDGGRWAFPGVGEFQCYDAFMLASLAACAQQAGQPHWGTSGPHDAGSYKLWPHQTGFFHHQGSFRTEYGLFFTQWYSGLLARHADRVLAAAAAALGVRGVRLHAALPLCHWWYLSASRAAELTAGYCGRPDRDAYVPVMQALARHGACAHLAGAEVTAAAQPPGALASPEALLQQLRGAAAAVGVPVGLANATVGFGAPRLAEIERKTFECGCYQGVDTAPVSRLVLAEMGDAMFEPSAWPGFREWVGRVRQRAAALGGPAQQPQQQQPQQQQQQQQQQADELQQPAGVGQDALPPVHALHAQQQSGHGRQQPQLQDEWVQGAAPWKLTVMA